jgi:glycerate 2-kinase
MSRILVACDSFKDAVDAQGACSAVAAGLRMAHPTAEIVQLPLSDGGEGVLEVLAAALGLRRIVVKVMDPLMRRRPAHYGLSADGATAVVEMAEAAGLERLALAERDPLRTTTFGVGQMLADARRRGATRVLLAIGGSATSDGGVGAAAALGWGFVDVQGRQVDPVGGRLQEIATLVPPDAAPLKHLQVLCDVTNHLHGPDGAARVFGRQKGGDEAALEILDDGLRHLAHLVETQLGLHGLDTAPGAGAAGGLGFGAMAFMQGELVRGSDTVLDLVGFDAAVAGADLVVTGEGRVDGQTAQGKLIQGVCARAVKAGVPVVALCGDLAASADQIRALGLRAAYSINPQPGPLSELLPRTAERLREAAARLAL